MKHLVTHYTVFVVVALLSAAPSFAQPQSESRLALLIGNATYKTSPLKNPVNDVRLMEASLKEAGFTVIKAENATRRDMQRMVRDFGERLKQSGGVGLFYFAGHGVQVKGANYLVPVDADIRSEDEVAFDSVDAQSILEKMETAKNRINLLILDACRDNPFAKGSRSGSAGLATMSAPSGSLVAYSTAPGSVASDGAGNNGLYTQHLAAVMRVPDMPIEEVFKRVRASVRKDSANQQTPWENTALEGNFYFQKSAPVVAAATPAPIPVPPQAPAPSLPSMMAIELAYWDSIKTSNRPFELEAYIEQFPTGSFVGLAKARLRAVADELTKSKPVTPPAVVAAVTAAPSPQAVPPIVPVAKTTPPALVVMAAPSRVDVIQDQQASGFLQLSDRMLGTQSKIQLQIQEKTEAFTLLSSGDKVAADGRVLQARFGEFTVALEQGQLWRLPLTVGQRGKADVVFQQGQWRFKGSLEWEIKPDASGTSSIVQADYRYLATGAYGGAGRYGVWTGSYEPQYLAPVASKYTQFGGSSRPQLWTTAVHMEISK
jgi:Caspase domain